MCHARVYIAVEYLVAHDYTHNYTVRAPWYIFGSLGMRVRRHLDTHSNCFGLRPAMSSVEYVERCGRHIIGAIS